MELPQQLRPPMEERERIDPMKLPIKSLLILSWVGVNITALSMIAVSYPVVWHSLQLSSTINHDDVLVFAHSATKDQLATELITGDTAIRGATKALIFTLNNWLEITLLNVVITLCYFFWSKRALTQ